MKHYTILTSLSLLLLMAGVTGCNPNSYSNKRAVEDQVIADFIKRQNISRLNRQWIGALFGRDRNE